MRLPLALEAPLVILTTGAALAIAGIGTAAHAAELPTPSKTLPYDIYSNTGGIDQQWQYDFNNEKLYSPDDDDYATPELRKHTASYNLTINNTYWKSLKVVGVEANAFPLSSPPQLQEATEDESAPSPKSAEALGLSRSTSAKATLSPVLSGDVDKSADKGGSLNLTFSIPFDKANVTYTKGGNLAAFAFEGNAAVYLEGKSTDDRTFVIKDAITFDETSPVFSNIRTGSPADCLPGQLCSEGSAYTLSGATNTVDFPPLETAETTPPTTPAPPAPPATPEPSSEPSTPATAVPTTPATPKPSEPATTAPAPSASPAPAVEPSPTASAAPELAYTGPSKDTGPLLIASAAALLLGISLLIWKRNRSRKEASSNLN